MSGIEATINALKAENERLRNAIGDHRWARNGHYSDADHRLYAALSPPTDSPTDSEGK